MKKEKTNEGLDTINILFMATSYSDLFCTFLLFEIIFNISINKP